MANVTTRPRVLVIDDQQLIADTLAKILEMNGFEATAHYSGEAALEGIESLRPEIVLSDIRMKRVSGIETARRIRELHPECRVILFTACPIAAATHHRIVESGFEFLHRPLHPAHVLNLLRTTPFRRQS